MGAASRITVDRPWKVALSLPSAARKTDLRSLQVQPGSGPGQMSQPWSFMGGVRLVLQPQALRGSGFSPLKKPKAFCASAFWLPGPEVAFTAGTVAVFPFYALMVLAPHAQLTKRSMESSLPYVALGAAYAFLLYHSWTADTTRLMFSGKYWLPELSAITRMFTNELTMASAWLHLLLVDLFAARQIFRDGLEHKVETRHSVSLCLFFCPIGIVAHVITKLLTPRGESCASMTPR